MANTGSSSANSSASVLLGVDLGTNHIRLGTIDRSGKVLAFRREHYPESSLANARSLADQLLSIVTQMIEEQSVTAPVDAVGVADEGEDRPALWQGKGQIGAGSVLVFVADPGSVGELTFEELVEDRSINFSGKAKGCGA